MKKEKRTKRKINVSTVKEVSEFFNRSEKWVYRHWEDIGGIKIGGTIMFPPLEVINDRFFSGRNGVQVRIPNEQKEVCQQVLQETKRCTRSRKSTEGGNKKGKKKRNTREDRHNVL